MKKLPLDLPTIVMIIIAHVIFFFITFPYVADEWNIPEYSEKDTVGVCPVQLIEQKYSYEVEYKDTLCFLNVTFTNISNKNIEGTYFKYNGKEYNCYKKLYPGDTITYKIPSLKGLKENPVIFNVSFDDGVSWEAYKFRHEFLYYREHHHSYNWPIGY